MPSPRMIIQAAVNRSELPTGTPPDLIIDAIMGRVIRARRLFGAHDREVLADEDVVWPVDADVVDVVLAVAELHDAVEDASSMVTFWPADVEIVKPDPETLPTVPAAPPAAGPDRALDPPPAPLPLATLLLVVPEPVPEFALTIP